MCQDSVESGRTSMSRGFDVDYGRFYNTSYLKSASDSSGRSRESNSRAEYRRSPSSSSSSSQIRVRHYHRPLHDNFSYSRRPHRTANKGVHFFVSLSHCVSLYIITTIITRRCSETACICQVNFRGSRDSGHAPFPEML